MSKAELLKNWLNAGDYKWHSREKRVEVVDLEVERTKKVKITIKRKLTNV